MSNKEDTDSLLAIARANQAKNRVKLCIDTIVKNEEFYVKREWQCERVKKLSPYLKTVMLAELSWTAFGALRHPAGKARVKFVRLLIHQGLESFDFVLLGNKFTKTANQQIWQCLVEVAGPSLRRIRDVRITNQALQARTLAWCLPFMGHMTQLEELHVTTLCCARGQLKQLSELVPTLKSLRLFLFKNLRVDSDDLHDKGKLLEELLFDSHDVDSLESSMLGLMWKIPQLRINCLRADELHPWKNIVQHDAQMSGTFNLTHMLIPSDFRYPEILKQFKDVINLKVTQKIAISAVDYTVFFPKLRTLNLRYTSFLSFALPMLQENGKFLTTLILDTQPGNSCNHCNFFQIDLFRVLELCKNLSTLIVRYGCVTSNVDPRPRGEDLLLTKLHLLDVDVNDSGLLEFILRAPLLAEVVLDAVELSVNSDALAVLASEVAAGNILTRLRSFKFTLQEPTNTTLPDSKFWLSGLAFSKNVITFCGMLREAEIKLCERQELELNNFISLVKGTK